MKFWENFVWNFMDLAVSHFDMGLWAVSNFDGVLVLAFLTDQK